MSNIKELDNQVLKALEDIAIKLNSERINVQLIADRKLKTITANMEAVQNCIINYRDNLSAELHIMESVNSGNPEALFYGYPVDGDITEKFRFLEDKDLKLWKLKDMEEQIRKIEGPGKADETLNSIYNALTKRVEEKTLISIMFNDIKRFVFYTTRKEWIETIDTDGKITYAIKPEHMPDHSKFRSLTEEEKKKITVKGL